jgi:hypothetical protein
MTPSEVGFELPPDIDVGARAVSLPRAVTARRGASIGAIAWLVPEALPMTDAEAREAIRSGRLPDGREFDPYRTALLEASGAAMNFSGPEAGHVRVEDWSNGTLVVDVTSPSDAFLVMAESAYPGWHATIDDRSVPVETANVAFQGVRVPAGQHRVVLRYFPRSLMLGAGVALAALIVLAFVLAGPGRSRRANSPGPGGRQVRAMDNP